MSAGVFKSGPSEEFFAPAVTVLCVSEIPQDFRGYSAKVGDRAWSRQKFADCHILFFERTGGYDYVAKLLA
jgi:hypothetical protein